MSSRRIAKFAAPALAIALGVNVAAAGLDARSDHARRAAAEHDARVWLAKHHVRAPVHCDTGVSCEVSLPDGSVAPLDPRSP